jgi:hypothetical protein
MPGGKANYLSDRLLDHVLGGSDFARPATVYVALFTVLPGPSGGGTEASGGGYSRQALANNSTNWPAASGQTKRNGVEIDFGAATADWGDIVGAALFDAPTGGNLLYYGPFSVTRTVRNGDSFKIPANGATITEA